MDNPFGKKHEPNSDILEQMKATASKVADSIKLDLNKKDNEVKDKIKDEVKHKVEEKIQEQVQEEVKTGFEKVTKPGFKHVYDDLKVEATKSVEQILAEHGGLESNIGINHPYWKMSR